MFHVQEGLKVQRLDNGGVEIFVPESPATGRSFYLTDSEWASVVASVSAHGETGVSYSAALLFHNATDRRV